MQVQRSMNITRSRSVIPSTRRRQLKCIAYSTDGGASSKRAVTSDWLVNFSTGLASAAVLISWPSAVQAAEPFLKSAGANDPTSQQQELLGTLQAASGQTGPVELPLGVLQPGLMQHWGMMESEAQLTQASQLCTTPFGVDIAGVTILIALVGAAVGGYTARQRKDEAERLNEQLRKINASLRQQARAGVMNAPSLQYTPPSSSSSTNRSTITLPHPAVTTHSPSAVTAAAAAASSAAAVPVAVRTLLSMEEHELTAEQIECKDTLRAGKRMLREMQAAGAQLSFEQALVLSRMIGDRVQERRAVRGLAAAARLQQQYSAAIGHLQRVLEISRELKEYTGDADAYGTIADCYTELGNFEAAAEFYDKYITRMED